MSEVKGASCGKASVIAVVRILQLEELITQRCEQVVGLTAAAIGVFAVGGTATT